MQARRGEPVMGLARTGGMPGTLLAGLPLASASGLMRDHWERKSRRGGSSWLCSLCRYPCNLQWSMTGGPSYRCALSTTWRLQELREEVMRLQNALLAKGGGAEQLTRHEKQQRLGHARSLLADRLQAEQTGSMAGGFL